MCQARGSSVVRDFLRNSSAVRGRQGNGAPTLFALALVLLAAVAAAAVAAAWARASVDLPNGYQVIDGSGPKRPERPLVGATPAQTEAAECPAFTGVFAHLQQALGRTLGEPLECPHVDPATGDTLQRTSTGLAIYRERTRTPTFTDGFRRWAVGPSGVITWEGDEVDPP
jgi:hypothetical protein